MTHRSYILSIVLIVCGCQNVRSGVPGSGVSKSESRDIGTFEEIEFAGAGRVQIDIGKPGPLTIIGDDNLLPLIETSVDGERLVIRPKEPISPKTTMVFKVTTAELKVLSFSGAAETTLTGIKNESLKFDLSGAGSFKVTGRTDRFELTLSGAAYVVADELIAREVIAELSGTGEADVHATEKLKASVMGAGVIRYKGDPKVEKEVLGVGSVQKKA